MKRENSLLTTLGSLVKFLFSALIFLMGSLILLKSLDYYTPNFKSGYLFDKHTFFKGWFSLGLYTHITVYPILLTLATLLILFQKRMSKKWHRQLGKSYVMLALSLGVPSAIILGLYSTTDTYSIVQFLTLALLYFAFTFLAYIAILKGNKQLHEKMIIRGFIILLSAIFTRYYSFIAIRFLGIFDYDLIVLCSWLPHLLIFEIFTLVKSKKGIKT